MKHLRSWVAAALLALSAPASAALPLHSPLPDAGWPSLDGPTVTLSALVGRPVLVNVWASWCQPCVKELPLFVELDRTHRTAGLQVIGVALDTEIAPVEAAVERHGLTYPVLHDGKGSISKAFRLEQIPATFLFDARGRLVWQAADVVDGDDPAFRAALKQVLAPNAPTPEATK